MGALSLIGFVLGAYVGVRLAPLMLAPRQRIAVCADARARSAASSAARCSQASSSGSPTRLRGALLIPGIGVADGLLGALFGAAARARRRVARWPPPWSQLRSGPSAARRRRALGDPQQPRRSPAADRRRAQRARPPRPAARDQRARARRSRRPPDGSPARPPSQRDAAERRARRRRPRAASAIEGSGWVAAPQTVVTNAHVVAGEQETTVQVPGVARSGCRPSVIEFDPHDDIAVLHVPGLELAPLALARERARGARRRDRRIPGRRPARGRRGAHRGDPGGGDERRLRQRPRRTFGHADPRPDPIGQLRWTRYRRRRATS